jgi:hypothetical protein
MKQPIYLVLYLLIFSGISQSGQAQDDSSQPNMSVMEMCAIAQRPPERPLGVFKLKARFNTDFDPVLIDLNGPRNRPKVDANLINQIDQVKMAVPGWHGLHNIIPGAGSAGGH